MIVDGFDYPHKSTGTILFDPKKGHKKYKDWFGLVRCDKQIIDMYCWFLKRYGIEIVRNNLWGPHITFIKGEKPKQNKDLWGTQRGQRIEFWYSNYVMYDNGRHAWINCVSKDLGELREFYGVPEKFIRGKFHITLGTIKGTVPKVWKK